MKYAWIDSHREEFELAPMCDALAVSVSGYQSWKRGGIPERKRLTDGQMLVLIRAIHAELKGAYGSPRITKELRDRGFPASKLDCVIKSASAAHDRRTGDTVEGCGGRWHRRGGGEASGSTHGRAAGHDGRPRGT